MPDDVITKVYTKYDIIPLALIVPYFRELVVKESPVIIGADSFILDIGHTRYNMHEVVKGVEGVMFVKFRR